MDNLAKRLADAVLIMRMVVDGRYTVESMKQWLESNYPSGRYAGKEQPELFPTMPVTGAVGFGSEGRDQPFTEPPGLEPYHRPHEI